MKLLQNILVNFNKYRKELEKPCFYVILINEHNIKEYDLINIQLVSPTKNFTYKKVKVLGIRKILAEEIYYSESYNAIEEVKYRVLQDFIKPKDKLIKFFYKIFYNIYK